MHFPSWYFFGNCPSPYTYTTISSPILHPGKYIYSYILALYWPRLGCKSKASQMSQFRNIFFHQSYTPGSTSTHTFYIDQDLAAKVKLHRCHNSGIIFLISKIRDLQVRSLSWPTWTWIWHDVGHIWAIMRLTTTRTHNFRIRRCDELREFFTIKSPLQRGSGGIRIHAHVVST